MEINTRHSWFEKRSGGQHSATCFGWSGPGPKQRSGHHYLHRGVWINLQSAIVLQPDVSVIIIISAFFAALHNLLAALVNSASDTYWLIWLELGRARHVSRRVLDILVTKTNNGRYVPDYYILSLINISRDLSIKAQTLPEYQRKQWGRDTSNWCYNTTVRQQHVPAVSVSLQSH